VPPPDPERVLAVCVAALRGRAEETEALRARQPELARTSVHVAAALLDAEALEARLAADPGEATAAGPRGVTPLALACSTRLGTDAEAAAVARRLLAAGAEPNDGRSLFAALEHERLALLEALLDGGGDPEAGDRERGQGLLHFAAEACWRPAAVERVLARGARLDARWGPLDESVLYTAVRRRRLDAVELLLERGADVRARTRGGDTAWRHAVRRPFPEVAARLAEAGADTRTTPADELARALLGRDLDAARSVLDAHPRTVAELVPEEARLLGDLAGQGKVESVRFLLDHGADVDARGLDGGTPLEQTAWFAQPAVTRLLLERGADVHATGCDHASTPLGWAAHGSRWSGGAEARQAAYLEVVELLLAAGAELALPGDPPGEPGARLLGDASDAVRARLRELD